MQARKRKLAVRTVFVYTMGLLSQDSRKASPNSPTIYGRHRPETTLLYQVIREYWPEFQAELANQGKYLPAYITQEFEEYLKCGRLEHGFLRVRRETYHDEKLVAFSCKRRGFCPSCGARCMAESAALQGQFSMPIYTYLSNDGSKLEFTQQMAGHADPKTTKIYDRRRHEISMDEVERIGI